ATLLSDPTRLVRTEAAQVLAAARVSSELRGEEKAAYLAALQDCFDSSVLDNDLAMGHVRIGVLYQNLGQFSQAEEEYKTAIRVDSKSVGRRANLADLYERRIESAQHEARQLAQSGDRRAAEQAVTAVRHLPEEIHRLREEELALTERDAMLVPDNAGI